MSAWNVVPKDLYTPELDEIVESKRLAAYRKAAISGMSSVGWAIARDTVLTTYPKPM